MDVKLDEETSGAPAEARDEAAGADGPEPAVPETRSSAALPASAARASEALRVVINVSAAARRLPDDVRASLEAVKAAQREAHERARRETRRARAAVAGIAVAVAVGVFVVWPRVRAGRAALPAVAAAIVPALTVAPARRTTPAAIDNAVAADAPSPAGLLAAGVAAFPPAGAPAPAPGGAHDAELDACRDSYAHKRWRAAADACAAAFTSHPSDAKLALRVAEAQHARDHLAEAGEWARRALALDGNQADALAIVAHAEQRAGDPDAAARAFRRYLALAPRGWHSPEAWAALRANRVRLAALRRAAPAPASPAARRAEDAPLGPTTAESEPAAVPVAPDPAD